MPVTDTNFNPDSNPVILEIKVAANLMAAIIEALPEGRRRACALRDLESATMWAVKAAAVGDT